MLYPDSIFNTILIWGKNLNLLRISWISNNISTCLIGVLRRIIGKNSNFPWEKKKKRFCLILQERDTKIVQTEQEYLMAVQVSLEVCETMFLWCLFGRSFPSRISAYWAFGFYLFCFTLAKIIYQTSGRGTVAVFLSGPSPGMQETQALLTASNHIGQIPAICICRPALLRWGFSDHNDYRPCLFLYKTNQEGGEKLNSIVINYFNLCPFLEVSLHDKP